MNKLEELLKKMIEDLRKQVVEKVPEHGLFDVVYEEYKNQDKRLNLSHILLKVSNTGVKGSEDKRYLEVAVLNYPNPYGAESVVGFGYTPDILARLQEDELLKVLMERVPQLARDVEYAEIHPYG